MCCPERGSGGAEGPTGAGGVEDRGPTKIRNLPSGAYSTVECEQCKPVSSPRADAPFETETLEDHCPICHLVDPFAGPTNAVHSFTNDDGSRLYRRERCRACGRNATTVYRHGARLEWVFLRGYANYPRTVVTS